MNWFLMSLIAPFLWSILNHADKFLISKYSKNGGIGGLVIYSSLFAVFALPVAFYFDQGIFSLNPFSILVLIATGLCYLFGILFYMHALEKDDASYVVAFWQFVPIFAYILGIIFLEEKLSSLKIIGSIITILGATILSLEFEEGKRFKSKVVLLMILSSLFLALSDVLFKYKALEETSFWVSIFWNQVGMTLFGICAFLLVKNYRKDFLHIVKHDNKIITGINLGGETIQTVASIFNYSATLLAPIALVLVTSYTFQPLFVFLEGILLTLLLPKIVKEKISRKHLIQKFLSIIIMSIGVYLIYS